MEKKQVNAIGRKGRLQAGAWAFRCGIVCRVTWEAVPGTVFDQPEPEELIELTVIVPARNEEDCLAECLESLVSQSDESFKLGQDWELIVVDDDSSDRTAEIAEASQGSR